MQINSIPESKKLELASAQSSKNRAYMSCNTLHYARFVEKTTRKLEQNHSAFSFRKKCNRNLMGRIQFVLSLYCFHSGYLVVRRGCLSYRSMRFSLVMMRVANTLDHTYRRMSQGSQCYTHRESTTLHSPVAHTTNRSSLPQDNWDCGYT